MKTTIQGPQLPTIPLIAENPENNVGFRDTQERVVSVLHLLTELNLSRDLSPTAENGLNWVYLMLIDSVKYVSDALETKTMHD